MADWDPIDRWQMRSVRTLASWRSLTLWADTLWPLSVLISVGYQATLFTRSPGQGRALETSLALTLGGLALLAVAFLAIALQRARVMAAAAALGVDVAGLGQALHRLGADSGNYRELTLKLHWHGPVDDGAIGAIRAVAEQTRCAAEVVVRSASTLEWKVSCTARFGAQRRLASFLTTLWPELARAAGSRHLAGVCIGDCEELECSARRPPFSPSNGAITVKARPQLADWLRVLAIPMATFVIGALISADHPQFAAWLLPACVAMALLAAGSIVHFTIRRRLFATQFVVDNGVVVVTGVLGQLARERADHPDFELQADEDRRELALVWQEGRARGPLQFEAYRALQRLGVREQTFNSVGASSRTVLEVNGRPLQELKGWLLLDCPSIGLRAWVKYNGCLPEG